MDTLEAMPLFVHVAQGPSLSSAARALGVTPSAVSKAVTRLERHLGCRLVERSSRAIRLTTQGELFYERAKSVLASVEEATDSLLRSRDAVRGNVRFAVPPRFEQTALRRFVPQLLERYPGLRLELVVDEDPVDPISAGVDLSLTWAMPTTGAPLVRRRLVTSALGLFASPSYVQRKGLPTNPEELRGHDFLSKPGPQKETRLHLERAGQSCDLAVAGPCLASDTAQLSLARAGVGILRAPVVSMRSEVDAGRLVQVLPEWSLGDTSAWLLFAKGASPRVRTLVDALVELVEQDP